MSQDPVSTTVATTAAATTVKVSAAPASAPAESGSWFYCLESRHPGAKDVLDDARFFLFDGDSEACPTCPACGKQVSAVPAAANGMFPSGILAVGIRLL